MNEITIVTGYFDIKRTGWTNYSRSNNDYIVFFKKWASIKNNLVVFTDNEEAKEKIIKFRDEKNLSTKTIVIFVRDIEKIDSRLYNSIRNVTCNKTHSAFRLQPNNPEVINPKYDYVMLLKEWCVYETVKNGYASGMIAWVDFGYNHGGQTIEPSDFDNLIWSYDFPNKICMFNCTEVDETRPVFDVVKNMNVYIMGTVIVAPSEMWVKLWDYVREEMYALNHCGLVDDDQTILLMVYLNHKDECELFKSSWNKMISDYCNNKEFHFVCNHEVKDNALKRMYRVIKWSIYKIKYCMKQYKFIKKLD